MSASPKDGIARDPTVLDGRSGGGAAADDAADALPAGHAAGEYVVERRLGGGAMGDVYAGRHPVIGKKVAIKVLKRELAGKAESAERFLREARAVNQIDHPNVVDVFAIGRLDDGRLYLVMDLLDGGSLRERLAADGAMAPDVALAILGQVAAALDAAHARGVIHRDLKPDNIVLTGPADRPAAHVLDFGIAKLLADAAGERVLETLTGQGAWLGTPAYMAPEQWSADGATAASDRYALGIVAYELLTGRPPFAATTLPGMMEQHFRAAVPSVTSTGAALHPALDRVFARALAKEPAERPETAAALVGELAAALGGKLRVTAGGDRRAGRGMWVAGAAGLAVAIAGAAIVVGGVGRRPARSEAAPVQPPPQPPATNVARVEVMTTPPGARVTRGGVDLGVTPLFVDVERGTRVELALSKPGCVPARLEIGDAPALVNANLALVTGFEGVWSLPDGTLRQFERRGDQVAGFELGAAQGPRSFLRMFDFVPTDGPGVAFAATEEHVDERAPDEPSCHIPLRAEYRYQPATDALELRREKAQYSLEQGRCVMQATAWGEARRLARIAGAPDDATWAESRAGGAAPQVLPDRKDPLQQQADNAPDPKQNQKPSPAPKKAPPGKKAVPPPAPPPDAQANDLPNEPAPQQQAPAAK